MFSRSIFTSLFIACSKGIGFLRDIVFSYYFGTGIWADAYNYASLYTSNIFILFGGLNGPFHSSIVAHIHGMQNPNRFITKILFWLLIAGLLMTIGIYFATKVLLTGQALYIETMSLLVFMLPCIVVTGIIGTLFGLVSYRGDHWTPAMSPIISSIIMIIFMLIWHTKDVHIALGLGTAIGVLLQVIIQYIRLYICDFRWTWDMPYILDIRSGMAYLQTLCPSLLGSTVGSLNVYVDMMFCMTLGHGAWTAIMLGNRLIQLPFGILIGGKLVGFLTDITQMKDNPQEMKQYILKTIGRMSLIMLPVIVLTDIFVQDGVRLLLQRGAFDSHSTAIVSNVIFWLSFSMITAIPREFLTRVFYVLHKAHIAFYVSLISIIINYIADMLLVQSLGVGGIALSTSITACINSIVLSILAWHYLKAHYTKES